MQDPTIRLSQIADSYEEASTRLLGFLKGDYRQSTNRDTTKSRTQILYTEVDDEDLPDAPGNQDYGVFSDELYLQKTAQGIDRCLNIFRSGNYMELEAEFDHINTYIVNLRHEDLEHIDLDILREIVLQASEEAANLEQYNEPDILQPNIILGVNDQLMRYFAENPHALYSIRPRLFEEIIGEIFRGFGCHIELTKQTRDGGYDIIVLEHNDYGTSKFIVECKRYSAKRKVDIDLVRLLYGTKIHSQATKAFLVTTSSFTKPALEFQKQHLWEMELKDFNDIQRWLKHNWKNAR